MKPLREIVPLKEIFDSHYPIKSDKLNSDRYELTHFKSEKGHKYHAVIATHIDSKHDRHGLFSKEVIFGRNGGEKSSIGINNDEGKDSHKVFGTVKHIIQKHLENNPRIKYLHFSSSDPSRHKLYDHMAKSFGQSYETEDNDYGDRHYKVKVR